MCGQCVLKSFTIYPGNFFFCFKATTCHWSDLVCRTVAHLCAAYGHEQILALILERNAKNQKAENLDVDEEEDAMSEGSEPFVEVKNVDVPDVLHVDAKEWTNNMTSLQVRLSCVRHHYIL